MSKHEVVGELQLSREQHAQLETYELTAIVDAIAGELRRFADVSGRRRGLDTWSKAIANLRSEMDRRDRASHLVEKLLPLRNTIRGTLEETPVVESEALRIQRSVLRLFDMLDTRIREFSAPSRSIDAWIATEVFVLRHSFELYFEVMSRCGDVPYKVQFSDAVSDDTSYRIVLKILPPDADTITIPPQIVDVIRDLSENARKYSQPGSLIRISLESTDDALRLTVSDAGIGIPEAEILSVVRHGQRGSNAGETSGTGIGLTKAYSLIRGWNGRMWIESSPAGTTIEAEIPRP